MRNAFLLALGIAVSSSASAADEPSPPATPAPLAPAAAPKAPASGLRFLPGREAGARESAFSGRPLLLLFADGSVPVSGTPAGDALSDPAFLRLAARFVPVLLEGAAGRKEAALSGVRVFPTVVFEDLRGGEAGRVEGPPTAAALLEGTRAALDRIGYVVVTPAARALDRSSANLARARKRSDWRGIVRAILAIEKVGHEGPALEEARRARSEAEAEAKRRLDAAAVLFRDGEYEEAGAALQRIVREFEGLPAADEARSLLDLLDADTDGSDGGGGTADGPGKNRKKPKSRSGGRANGSRGRRR